MSPEIPREQQCHIEPREGYSYWCWLKTVAFPVAVRDTLFVAVEEGCLSSGGDPINQVRGLRQIGIISAALSRGIRILNEKKSRREKEEVFQSTLAAALELSVPTQNDDIYTLPLSGLYVTSPLLAPNVPFCLRQSEMLLLSDSRFIRLFKEANSALSLPSSINSSQNLFHEFFSNLPPIAPRY